MSDLSVQTKLVKTRSFLSVNNEDHVIFRIKRLQKQGVADIGRLPFSIKVLLENLLRRFESPVPNQVPVMAYDVLNVAKWQPRYEEQIEIPFFPGRVVMQDFTGVPAVADLAAMRDAMKKRGKDVSAVNPAVPVDLVVDHSIQVDHYGSGDALEKNTQMEYRRNGERYGLLKWAQNAFDHFRIFPSGAGIIHQVNLEYISRVVSVQMQGGEPVAMPDTLIGTDSHTTMINGLGVLGWGVGGIEAESVMLGQPLYMKIPEVLGVRLEGRLPAGVTATDLVLTITGILRKEGVVEKFVEFFGPGLGALSLPNRATIANMSPEYGATMGFFPVDHRVLEYLETTNRGHLAELVEIYTREQGMFHQGDENPDYTKVITVDLASVEPSLAGPTRPQDRVGLYDIKDAFPKTVLEMAHREPREVEVPLGAEPVTLTDGSLVVAAITSCTNTSNPSVLMAAGLLAKKAVEKGLSVPRYVKTSFAPGSRVVEAYLQKARLMPYLEQLGFHIVGFGCTTCIGNSGPLAPPIEAAVRDNNLVVAAILSGNRNFEARIHQRVRANYLASPPLVVAFALAGKIDIDMKNQPLGHDLQGNPVFLKDIWPTEEEIDALTDSTVTPDIFADRYEDVLGGDENWKALAVPKGETFEWKNQSTYIHRPPFLEDAGMGMGAVDIEGARALLVLGDSVTTDHISPAGAISPDYPAGKYLSVHGTAPEHFNTYGSRRGNHEIMVRGTFANIRIKNKLVSPKEGGYTMILPDNTEAFVFDAAQEYRRRGTPLVVFGGKEYGSGSSRDWAAKGTLLLGVRAVVARSFERIHRGNLVGMGVLPLQFEGEECLDSLGLSGREVFTISGITDIAPRKRLSVTAVDDDGKTTHFHVRARLDTEIDVAYFKSKGILPYVLDSMAETT